MLYLNDEPLEKISFNRVNLTLTSVVFEFYYYSIKIEIFEHLTLTSVVFEFAPK